MGDAIEVTADNAGEALNNTMSNVTEFANETASDIGDAVEETVEDASIALNNTADAASDMFQDLNNTVNITADFGFENFGEIEGYTRAGFTYYYSYAQCCPDNENFDDAADKEICETTDICKDVGLFSASDIGQKDLQWVRENDLVRFYDASDPMGEFF